MGTPLVPPMAMFKVSLRNISKRNTFCSGSCKYSVPASAWVMRFAASKMVSSRLLMSCWRDSAMPISLSSFKRSLKLGAGCMSLLDADGTNLMHIGDALQDFFDTVLLQGAHPLLQRECQQFRDTRMFLYAFFHFVRTDQQFMQSDTPAIPCA